MGLRGPKRKEMGGLEADWGDFFRALAHDTPTREELIAQDFTRTENLVRSTPVLNSGGPRGWFDIHRVPDMEYFLVQTSEAGEEKYAARRCPKEMKDEFQRWFDDKRNWYIAEWCEWPGPEPDIFERLLRARSARQVRAACEDSCRWRDVRFVDLSLYYKTSNFILYLWHHAREFLQARNNARFPRSRRPKSEEKRIKFLAHAMANVCVGLSPLTVQRHDKKSRRAPA